MKVLIKNSFNGQLPMRRYQDILFTVFLVMQHEVLVISPEVARDRMKRHSPSQFPIDPNKRSRGLTRPNYQEILFALDQVDLSTDELHHLSNKIAHLYSLKTNKIIQPFPPELWHKIFHKAALPKLPLADLLCLRTVCQSWNKVICSFTKVYSEDANDPSRLLQLISLNDLTLRLAGVKYDFSLLTGLKSLRVIWGSSLTKAQSWSHNLTEFAPLTNLTKLKLCCGHITSLGPLTSIHCLSLKTLMEPSEVAKLPNLTRLVSTNLSVFSSGRGMFKGNTLTYDGEWEDGRFHGQGTLILSGDRYEGSFKNGKKDGFGKYRWAHGDEYEGDYLDGDQHGHGIYRHVNGDIYEGPYVQGKRKGHGVWIFDDGIRYEGEFDEEPQGTGRFSTPWGDVLEGTFTRGGFEGFGTYIFAERGGKYIGNFASAGFNGAGRWEYDNGDVFVGNFLDSHRDGHGVLTFANGDVFEGEWKDWKRFGVMKYADGRPPERGEWPDEPYVDFNWLEHVEKLQHKWGNQ